MPSRDDVCAQSHHMLSLKPDMPAPPVHRPQKLRSVKHIQLTLVCLKHTSVNIRPVQIFLMSRNPSYHCLHTKANTSGLGNLLLMVLLLLFLHPKVYSSLPTLSFFSILSPSPFPHSLVPCVPTPHLWQVPACLHTAL